MCPDISHLDVSERDLIAFVVNTQPQREYANGDLLAAIGADHQSPRTGWWLLMRDMDFGHDFSERLWSHDLRCEGE
jgi:hypothetical protein